MKKKVKKRIKIFSIVFVILILLGVVSYFGFRQSFLSIQGLSEAHETIIWEGKTVELSSPYFGTITDGPRREFCGSNDGDTTITNTYTSNSQLILKSSTSAREHNCYNNGIITKLKISEGKLIGTCDLGAGASRSSNGFSTPSCKISSGLSTLYELSSYACDPNIGSCNLGSDPKSENFELIFSEPTEITITIMSHSAGPGSSSSQLTLDFEELIIPEPTIPEPSGFSKFINKIKEWIKNLFSNFFIFQSIVGPQTVEPNTQHTYQIDLTAQIPDSDYTDGTMSYQWGNWALIDSNGNIKQEGIWEEVNGVYTKSVTITTPSDIGNYVLVGLITQYDMNFDINTGQWLTGEEQIVNKEAIDLKSEYSIISPEIPIPGGFSKFIDSIGEWLNNIWDWIQFWN